jgi:hypothetical protein
MDSTAFGSLVKRLDPILDKERNSSLGVDAPVWRLIINFFAILSRYRFSSFLSPVADKSGALPLHAIHMSQQDII